MVLSSNSQMKHTMRYYTLMQITVMEYTMRQNNNYQNIILLIHCKTNCFRSKLSCSYMFSFRTSRVCTSHELKITVCSAYDMIVLITKALWSRASSGTGGSLTRDTRIQLKHWCYYTHAVIEVQSRWRGSYMDPWHRCHREETAFDIWTRKS